MDGGCDKVQEEVIKTNPTQEKVIKTNPPKKKSSRPTPPKKKSSRPTHPRKRSAKWLSEEALQIAVKRREAKSKGEKERYTHLNAEFQRTARKKKNLPQ